MYFDRTLPLVQFIPTSLPPQLHLLSLSLKKKKEEKQTKKYRK